MYEDLVDLYDRLDAYRRQRARIAQYGLFWVVAMVLSLVLVRILRFNAITFYAYIAFVVILVAVVGLRLLASFIQNEVHGRELERDVRAIKLHAQFGDLDDDLPGKRKRDDGDVRYAVGDDGELVEITDDDQLHMHGR